MNSRFFSPQLRHHRLDRLPDPVFRSRRIFPTHFDPSAIEDNFALDHQIHRQSLPYFADLLTDQSQRLAPNTLEEVPSSPNSRSLAISTRTVLFCFSDSITPFPDHSATMFHAAGVMTPCKADAADLSASERSPRPIFCEKLTVGARSSSSNGNSIEVEAVRSRCTLSADRGDR